MESQNNFLLLKDLELKKMSQLIFARNRVKTCLLQNYFAQNSFRSFRTSPMKFSKENVNKGKLNEFSRLLGLAKPDKKKIAGRLFST